MPKIKVMQFIHGMSTGGAETLVKDYLKYIDKKKFEPILLCLRHFDKSPYEGMIKELGIRTIYVEDRLWLKSNNLLAKLFNYLHSHIIIRRIIRKEKPDVIHTHLCVNSYVKFAGPPKDTFLIHTVHNEPKKLWCGHRKGDLKAVKYLINKYGMNLIVLHDKMKKEITNLLPTARTIILNNGIDVARFSGESKNSIRDELGLSDGTFIVGHVGRFSESKNHMFLVDIFKEIVGLNNNAFLLMVGDGEKKDMVKDYLHQNHLDNHYAILSNRNDIPDILKTMDVFVFPSLYEGLPVSLVEAQEVKLPCFISSSICKDVCISNLINVVSLEEGAKEWAKRIINYKKPRIIKLDDEEWNIQKITKKLERIYTNGVKGDA